ncbi:MAG: hypothetical protein ACTSQ5_10440 [Promethearchaeota archaeon]
MSVQPMSPFFKEIKKSVELTMTGNYAVAGAVSHVHFQLRLKHNLWKVYPMLSIMES